MKKVFERIVEGMLTCSGFVTSITILLIVLFLFTEAFGLFKSKVIEEGYVLALNKSNKVSVLSPAQIKNVFDEEITNWKELGGEDLPIRVFRLEDITQYYTEEELGPAYEYAGDKITELVEKTPGIVAFVPQKFIVHPDAVHFIEDNTISVKDVFAGAEWFPTATPAAQFGFLPLITGTLWVSLFAILFALPFGLSVSIYMSEVANPKVRNWLKPIIELLSGIPSVVYGFFGLIVIVPLIQKLFNLPVGESGLAGLMKEKSKSEVSIIGGADGPTSIFIAGRTRKKPLKVRIRNIIYRYRRKIVEKKVVADSHTLDELVQYAMNTYNLIETNSTERKYIEQQKNLKESLILQHKPEVLGEMKDIPKPDVSNEESVREYFCKIKTRSEMIAEMPDNVIPMNFHLYEIRIGDDSLEMEIDYIWNIFGISYSGNKKVMKQFEKISKDLYIYYGVSEDDIKKKTERYLSLVTALSS